jgi:prepilin-type processing-associated H-X9-DG protein
MYLNDAKGKLPYSVWHNPPQDRPSLSGNELNEFIWNGFWFGLLGKYRITSSQLLCPEATDPVPVNMANVSSGIIGAGTAKNAWSGQWQTASPVGIMITNNYLNLTNDPAKGGYRIGSYGFNGNLHSAERKLPNPPSSESHFGRTISSVKSTIEVPVFYDAIWIDNAGMENGSASSQPQAPPNLQGLAPAGGNNNDWRILIDRHDRAINVCFADGHATRVALEDTYNMQWTPYWKKYSRTNLPKK